MRFFVPLSLFFLAGCYSPFGMWVRSNFSFECPNRYEKQTVRDSCDVEHVSLKLEEHVWATREDKIPEVLSKMKTQVLNERLYINEIIVGRWRGDTALVIFASNKPTSIGDKDELERHKYHKIREEKCGCRLCR